MAPVIGYFGDDRLARNGALMVQRVGERQTVCLRKLCDDRAEQVRFQRFLANKAVTVAEMIAHRAEFVAVAAAGRHVLAIQDTSEINYEAQRGRKRRLGTVGNGSDVGLFVHPVLAVDATCGECLGLVDAQVWRRTKSKDPNYKKLPIELKESYRWLHGGSQAKAVLADAAMVTVIDDREADIYEKWDRLPDSRTHLLTRASRDRCLADGSRLFKTLAGFAEAHRFVLALPARPGKKRSARQATMAVRFGRVRIRRPLACSDPKAPAEIDLFALEVRELEPPHGQIPVLWRLLTTHAVETLLQALTIVGWYRHRWHIEQLFRTLKRQGLRLEQAVVEDGAALEKLAVIALIAAATTMQLVLAKAAADQSPPASRVFSPQQIVVLGVLLKTRQGRTPKQQNPYPPDSLAAAAWIIARLGGWTGYDSDKGCGPITIRDGLERFYAIVDGYSLAAQHLCAS
ncbi:IS4 family transposase [Vineibacter terrae]|uniref:IS4 family transposase n=1 Tax=Vineibacter terrae TaxID=2586908 RepID=A0A5C8P717_9HYPH|nr:IS4 family transposase [Vineibacter terrae]TXL69091.1 IS4 family transposase [Vineibacter terrae]